MGGTKPNALYFYCLLLCAMSCNSENISTKIKLFLCFKNIKRCQIVIKCCWSRCIPQDRLNLIQIKILFSRFQLRTCFYNPFSEMCIFRSKQQSLKWGFVILEMSLLKAIRSFMLSCVTLELQWDNSDCAK